MMTADEESGDCRQQWKHFTFMDISDDFIEYIVLLENRVKKSLRAIVVIWNWVKTVFMVVWIGIIQIIENLGTNSPGLTKTEPNYSCLLYAFDLNETGRLTLSYRRKRPGLVEKVVNCQKITSIHPNADYVYKTPVTVRTLWYGLIT